MADMLSLLRDNYDAKYGIVNVRPVVDQLLKTPDFFGEAFKTFGTAEPRWRLPILEAMRTLAATGHCNERSGDDLLSATEIVIADAGTDEYFKSINALVASPQAAGSLAPFVSRLLEQGQNDFRRRLAFYTIGMLVEHRRGHLAVRLRDALKSAATEERSAQLRRQFGELLEKL